VRARLDASPTAEPVEAGRHVGQQPDGLLDAEPARLEPENVRKAIDGKPAGPDIFGPIEVNGTYWVFRIETIDKGATYTETQKSQLADLTLQDAVAAKRPQVTVKRTITGSDYDWAGTHAGK